MVLYGLRVRALPNIAFNGPTFGAELPWNRVGRGRDFLNTVAVWNKNAGKEYFDCG